MQFVITPDWNPMETAPKNRPIWLAFRSLDFETGKQHSGHVQGYWGVMLAYPDAEACWLPVGGPDNALIAEDMPFRKEVSIHDDHGQARELTCWRGYQLTHWAEIINHTVLIVKPHEHNFPVAVETQTTDRRTAPKLAGARS